MQKSSTSTSESRFWLARVNAAARRHPARTQILVSIALSAVVVVVVLRFQTQLGGAWPVVGLVLALLIALLAPLLPGRSVFRWPFPPIRTSGRGSGES